MRRTVGYIEAVSSLLDAEFAVVPSIVRVRCADWAAFNGRLSGQRPGGCNTGLDGRWTELSVKSSFFVWLDFDKFKLAV